MTRQSFAHHHLGAMVTAWQVRENLRRMYWPRAARVSPHEVVGLLKQSRVRFVLVGTYGINGYRDQPTATQDVDILLLRRDLTRATRVLGKRYPRLRIVQHAGGVWFMDRTTGRPVIDLLLPVHESMQAIFKNAVRVGSSHRIPDLEMALVGKFAGFALPQRDTAKGAQRRRRFFQYGGNEP